MADSSTRTVERALALLAFLCDDGPAALADCARATELSPSTALRLLRTMEASGFVSRDPDGSYRAGSRLVQLGVRTLSSESLNDYCHTEMERLAAEAGEDVYLSVRGHGESALYIGIVEGTHSVRHVNWVGRTIPLTGSAAGAVLTAPLPESGYVVVERGVEPDVTAIATALRSASRVIAVLSFVIPSYRLTPALIAQYGATIAASTARLSEGLAHPRTKEFQR